MENRGRSNIFHQFWKWTQKKCKDVDCTGSQCRQEKAVTSESRILDIEKAESAKRAALCQHAERVCAAEKARNDAVLERLGLSAQNVALPSPQPPALPRQQAPSLRARRFNSPLGVRYLNVEGKSQKSPERVEEEDDEDEDDNSLWDQLRLCSKEAQVAAGVQSPTASISSVSGLSSADSHTPTELRAISLIRSPVEVTGFKPTPPPPRAVPLSRRRASRLPVFHPKLGGEVKVVADGCKLQTVTHKVEAVVERLQRFQLNFIHPPQPPAAAKRITEEAPLAPTPPAAPQTQRRGPRPGMILRPAKAASGAGKKTAGDCSLQTTNKAKVELQPLNNPVESLSRTFSLLSSDDWTKKSEGLKTIQALAQHHVETLKPKLHEVCLVLIEEVKNLRSAVACEAMNTLSELYIHLQKTMDPEVEGTGRALLLKLAQTTNTFIHQQANLALDAMVQNCSYGRLVSALLNTGLNHLCNAVRGSTAQHLHLLVDKFGAAHIFTAAGKSFTKRVLTAVAKMSVDAAPEVRQHGQIILHQLALHKDFLNLLMKIVPDCERRQLDKILKKT